MDAVFRLYTAVLLCCHGGQSHVARRGFRRFELMNVDFFYCPFVATYARDGVVKLDASADRKRFVLCSRWASKACRECSGEPHCKDLCEKVPNDNLNE